MRDFFKSTRFKVLALLLVLVLAFALRAAQTGNALPMVSKLAAAVVTPVQQKMASASYAVRQGLYEYFSGPRIHKQNEQLQAENAALRANLVEYDKIKAENEQLKKYLGLRKKHTDFDIEPAMVIGRDPLERFYSFTIDCGSKDGVAVNDPVITQDGLVGRVSEVGISHAKVLTILDMTVEVGAMTSSTREIGVTAGDMALAEQGQLRISYLPRDSKTQAGELVVTTGIGGLYPKDLVLGKISEMLPDEQGFSLYAIIEPISDLRTLRDVMVVKSFEGQEAPQQDAQP